MNHSVLKEYCRMYNEVHTWYSRVTNILFNQSQFFII